MKECIPLLIGVTPFGLVCGITAQGAGLSFLETFLMSASVYAGSAQLVVLANWAHPAPVVAATLATFAVNLRMALMGPVLSPWLDRLRGWRLWGSLFVMADQNWAQALGDMTAGGRDAGVLLGSGLIMWVWWIVTGGIGHAMGTVLSLPPGHPLFFAALAVFVSMLANMWRGWGDVLPWVIAGGVAVVTARLLPGTAWYIVAGALAGSMTGGLRDHFRR
nr:AzlC family ABC transporter permease [Limobrevibacterium gyesilva]